MLEVVVVLVCWFYVSLMSGWFDVMMGLLIACAAVAFLVFKVKRGRSLLGLSHGVVGHRGVSGHPSIPENTLSAIQRAIDNGADAVEIDVRLTKDNYPVLFHDSETLRLMEENHRISEITYKQLKELKFTINEEESIPSLADALRLVKECDHRVELFIEIKEVLKGPLLARMIAEHLHRFHMEDQAVVISFNILALYQLRRINPKIATGVLRISSNFISLLLRLLKVPMTNKAIEVVDRAFTPFFNLLISLSIGFTGATMVGLSHAAVSKEVLEDMQKRELMLYVFGKADKERLKELGACVTADRIEEY